MLSTCRALMRDLMWQITGSLSKLKEIFRGELHVIVSLQGHLKAFKWMVSHDKKYC